MMLKNSGVLMKKQQKFYRVGLAWFIPYKFLKNCSLLKNTSLKSGSLYRLTIGRYSIILQDM